MIREVENLKSGSMTILIVKKLVRGRSRLRSFVTRLFRYILISVKNQHAVSHLFTNLYMYVLTLTVQKPKTNPYQFREPRSVSIRDS